MNSPVEENLHIILYIMSCLFCGRLYVTCILVFSTISVMFCINLWWLPSPKSRSQNLQSQNFINKKFQKSVYKPCIKGFKSQRPDAKEPYSKVLNI